MAEMTPADVLEEAADLLLTVGRARYIRHATDGSHCLIGAVEEVTGSDLAVGYFHPALVPLGRHLGFTSRAESGVLGSEIANWNDGIDDDFEVIDTLRLVAKDLRNEAVPS